MSRKLGMFFEALGNYGKFIGFFHTLSCIMSLGDFFRGLIWETSANVFFLWLGLEEAEAKRQET